MKTLVSLVCLLTVNEAFPETVVLQRNVGMVSTIEFDDSRPMFVWVDTFQNSELRIRIRQEWHDQLMSSLQGITFDTSLQSGDEAFGLELDPSFIAWDSLEQ